VTELVHNCRGRQKIHPTWDHLHQDPQFGTVFF
jgi:hypothetical protein